MIVFPGYLYAQSWEWATPFHAAGATTVSDMIVHHDSLIFVSGTCFSSFNYNGNTLTVTPDDGPSKDSWLLRTDASGNVHWYVSITSDNEVEIQQIAARNNRLYVAGKHKGTRVIFNNDTLFAFGNEQWIMFVAVYDLNGNYINASQLAMGTLFTITDMLAINDLYITGSFSQTIKISSQIYNTALDKLDIFVLKCDTTPDNRWFRHAPNGDVALIKANPAMDTLFVAAHYIDSLFMGPYTPYSSGSSVCLFATDTAFQLHWTRNIASDSVILADALFTNNRMYLTGWYNGTADFGNGMQPAPLSAKAWLSSYSATDGTHASLLLSNGEHNYGKSIAADRAGNVYLAVRSASGTTGILNQTIDLSIFPGNEHNAVLKINGDSLLRYYRILSHTGLSDLRVSACDHYGNYYCGGVFAQEMLTDSMAFS